MPRTVPPRPRRARLNIYYPRSPCSRALSPRPPIPFPVNYYLFARQQSDRAFARHQHHALILFIALSYTFHILAGAGRDCVYAARSSPRWLIAHASNFNRLDYPGTVLVSFTIFIMPLRPLMYPNTPMHGLCASSIPACCRLASRSPRFHVRYVLDVDASAMSTRLTQRSAEPADYVQHPTAARRRSQQCANREGRDPTAPLSRPKPSLPGYCHFLRHTLKCRVRLTTLWYGAVMEQHN